MCTYCNLQCWGVAGCVTRLRYETWVCGEFITKEIYVQIWGCVLNVINSNALLILDVLWPSKSSCLHLYCYKKKSRTFIFSRMSQHYRSISFILCNLTRYINILFARIQYMLKFNTYKSHLGYVPYCLHPLCRWHSYIS